MNVIIPKTYIEKIETPLIFLAGPIRGAENWQDKAIKEFSSYNLDLTIASPRRGIRDEIANYILTGNENYFPRQRYWERHYFDVVKQKGKGTVMFWLPEEKEHNCEKAFGAMTRFELGLFLGWYKYDKNTSFCIGTNGKFSEMNTILCDFGLDAPNKKIFGTLEETCKEAISLVYNQ